MQSPEEEPAAASPITKEDIPADLACNGVTFCDHVQEDDPEGPVTIADLEVWMLVHHAFCVVNPLLFLLLGNIGTPVALCHTSHIRCGGEHPPSLHSLERDFMCPRCPRGRQQSGRRLGQKQHLWVEG